jgi:hypothetical protein
LIDSARSPPRRLSTLGRRNGKKSDPRGNNLHEHHHGHDERAEAGT